MNHTINLRDLEVAWDREGVFVIGDGEVLAANGQRAPLEAQLAQAALDQPALGEFAIFGGGIEEVEDFVDVLRRERHVEWRSCGADESALQGERLLLQRFDVETKSLRTFGGGGASPTTNRLAREQKQWEKALTFARPVFLFGACDFSGAGQRLDDCRIVFFGEHGQQLVTDRVAGVIEIRVG